jgi:hypothetical protein
MTANGENSVAIDTPPGHYRADAPLAVRTPAAAVSTKTSNPPPAAGQSGGEPLRGDTSRPNPVVRVTHGVGCAIYWPSLHAAAASAGTVRPRTRPWSRRRCSAGSPSRQRFRAAPSAPRRLQPRVRRGAESATDVRPTDPRRYRLGRRQKPTSGPRAVVQRRPSRAATPAAPGPARSQRPHSPLAAHPAPERCTTRGSSSSATATGPAQPLPPCSVSAAAPVTPSPRSPVDQHTCGHLWVIDLARIHR